MSTTRSWALTILVAGAGALGCSGHGREPTGGTGANASPTRDGGSLANADASVKCTPRPLLGASEVVFVGESFVALTRAVPDALSLRARAANAIQPDQSYRDLSIAGSELSQGAMLAQYERGAAAGPVKVVLLSGGLYDVLLGGRCAAGYDARCGEITAALETLLAQMASDGTQDVLYFFYPDPGGIGAHIKGALDVLRPELRKSCEASRAPRCHWIDLRTSWADHPEYSIDGIHPSNAGAHATADVLWHAMAEACIVP